MNTLIPISIKIIQAHPVIVLIAVLVSYFTASYLGTRFFHLGNIPGPSLAGYSRLWLLKTLASEKSAEIFVQVNDQYGPLARIGPNLLLTNDPEIWRKILSVRSNYERGPWFDCLRIDPYRANLITERNRETHNALRYIMAAGYEGKNIAGFTSTIDENLSEWIAYIEKHCLGKKFDIARSIQWLDFDLICRLCLGYPLGFISEHSDRYNFQKTLEERLPIVEKLGVLAEVGLILKIMACIPLLKRALPSAKDSSGVGKILGLARQSTDQRFEPGYVAKNDMLDSWLNGGVSRDQVETEVLIALFAGSDTTATSLRAMILYITSNPIVYRRLISEIDGACTTGAISPMVTVEEARKLPYLQACIKEGIRIYPPIAALRGRVTPPEGDTINGQSIPGGVEIGVNMRGLLSNKQTFGSDANLFRPERWLEADSKQLREMERVHELAFNWGFTRCLGINLATTMMNKFLVECFRRWDIIIENPLRPWNSRCHGIFFHKDFYVRISPRHINMESRNSAVACNETQYRNTKEEGSTSLAEVKERDI